MTATTTARPTNVRAKPPLVPPPTSATLAGESVGRFNGVVSP